MQNGKSLLRIPEGCAHLPHCLDSQCPDVPHQADNVRDELRKEAKHFKPS